ncbi:MAG: hypothetical protein PHO07_15355 [Pirellulales bacterium]|nr:hypothetical protein [Thermoguttaceae bacterium]MDD4788551.1 hypothetical protein [Pirellulales bacterium]MDI9445665.1 nitrilase-related carbon-nitrogen hydrolase [Planctomycetota bacterium]NLZ02153.1 hypothetical protein [Pirellulaceae bacterium]
MAVVQTRLQLYDRAAEFAAHMARRLEEAMEHRPQLVVLPEDIGTPLLTLGDAGLLADCQRLAEARTRLADRYRGPIEAACARWKVSPARGLWLVKADRIREVYGATFSDLARKHRVHIIAGSVPWAVPQKCGEVHNASCLFKPDGSLHVVARKVHLTPLERSDGLDLSPGEPQDLRVFEVEEVKVGVLVCADGWHGELADRLVKQGAELLVQVSANPEVWGDGTRRGWESSLFTQVERLGVYGVVCMGVGSLFELPFQGQSQIIAPRRPDGPRGRRPYVLRETRSATEEEVISLRLEFPAPRKKGQ